MSSGSLAVTAAASDAARPLGASDCQRGAPDTCAPPGEERLDDRRRARLGDRNDCVKVPACHKSDAAPAHCRDKPPLSLIRGQRLASRRLRGVAGVAGCSWKRDGRGIRGRRPRPVWCRGFAVRAMPASPLQLQLRMRMRMRAPSVAGGAQPRPAGRSWSASQVQTHAQVQAAARVSRRSARARGGAWAARVRRARRSRGRAPRGETPPRRRSAARRRPHGRCRGAHQGCARRTSGPG